MSLTQQTCSDFEWLVVDDGSTDNTQELIATFQQAANFPITLITQTHSGKMRAHNLALQHSRGKLFLNVDSDDHLYPHTLSRLKTLWDTLPPHPVFAGISVLSSDLQGKVIGKDFGAYLTDSSYDAMYCQNHLGGDRLELWLAVILKSYPYPVADGEKFVPDGFIYHQISRSHCVRFLNEALQVVVYQPDGISRNSIPYRAQNPQGMCCYYQDMITHLPSSWVRTRCLINLFRYLYHQPKRPVYPPSSIPVGQLGSMVCQGIGWLLFQRDRSVMAFCKRNRHITPCA